MGKIFKIHGAQRPEFLDHHYFNTVIFSTGPKGQRNLATFIFVTLYNYIKFSKFRARARVNRAESPTEQHKSIADALTILNPLAPAPLAPAGHSPSVTARKTVRPRFTRRSFVF